jgi:hypothetical protein
VLRGTFAIRVRVITSASAPTRMTLRLDGRHINGSNKKSALLRIYGYQVKRRGPHTLTVAVRFGYEKLARTIRFRRC